MDSGVCAIKSWREDQYKHTLTHLLPVNFPAFHVSVIKLFLLNLCCNKSWRRFPSKFVDQTICNIWFPSISILSKLRLCNSGILIILFVLGSCFAIPYWLLTTGQIEIITIENQEIWTKNIQRKSTKDIRENFQSIHFLFMTWYLLYKIKFNLHIKIILIKKSIK